uniref:Uncharacterized protein n=1 Tax=Periophthalmus magnuspinnatus TaxID=409849 RepID=A0A3B3ZCH0_9GOBI
MCTCAHRYVWQVSCCRRLGNAGLWIAAADSRLMKKGLTLILVGHINFILGAIVHGNVLRHISKPNQHVTTEYTVANIISVTSGLLVTAGIIAIVVSRNLRQIGLLITSFLNALLSAACCIGLLLAIGVTVAHNGQGLMQGCNSTGVPINARSPISAHCPFDTTRIYVSKVDVVKRKAMDPPSSGPELYDGEDQISHETVNLVHRSIVWKEITARTTNPGAVWDKY